jgi:FKBP-type peptidyl-prolyl cis-trans isomerase (trigger factor)
MERYSVLVSASQQKVGQVGIPVNWTTPDGERRLAALQVQALRQVVKNAVIGQLASERKIAVSDDDLTRALAEIEAALGGPEAFEGQLTQDGLSLEDFAAYFRFNLLDRLLRQADPGYPAALEQALASARVLAYVGPCTTNHQYPGCLGDS